MTLRTGTKAFTLLEVMITTVVLALGSIVIYQAFFTSLNAFDYYSTYLSLAFWMDEKIWQVQDELRRLGPASSIETSGEVINKNKNFPWNLKCVSLGQNNRLYRIDLVLSWQSGKRRVSLSRSAYAMYDEEK